MCISIHYSKLFIFFVFSSEVQLGHRVAFIAIFVKQKGHSLVLGSGATAAAFCRSCHLAIGRYYKEEDSSSNYEKIDYGIDKYTVI